MEVNIQPYFCLWIRDLLESTFHPEKKMSTWNGWTIQKVDILGTVVTARTYEKRSEYDIDDGTGVIHCCWFHRDPPAVVPEEAAALCEHDAQLPRLPLGTLVHVRGGLQEYRERKQVVAYSIRHVTDPDEESARVFRQSALYETVYLGQRQGFSGD